MWKEKISDKKREGKKGRARCGNMGNVEKMLKRERWRGEVREGEGKVQGEQDNTEIAGKRKRGVEEDIKKLVGRRRWKR